MMKNTLILLFLVMVSIISCEAQTSDVIVLQNVKLLTMESDEILDGRSVIIRGGVIDWVGNAGTGRNACTHSVFGTDSGADGADTCSLFNAGNHNGTGHAGCSGSP